MNPFKLTLLMALSLTSFIGDVHAQTPLEDMTHAYATGDFKLMTSKMKEALEQSPEDPFVRKNVFDLLTKSYEIRGADGLPADWHLPSEITIFKVAVRRVLKGEVHYKFKVQGVTKNANSIKQIQVTHSGQVVLDRLAGIGEWDDETISNEHGFGFQTKSQNKGFDTGLYLLKIELNDGTKTDGWLFVDDDMNAETAPVVASPQDDQIYNTGYPTFHWTNFFSSNYRPYENRSIWIGVSRNEAPNYDWDQKWEMWKSSPTLDQVMVGNKLDTGHYVVYFNYTELKRFGDIQVGRASVTGRNFQVKP